jgi:hypothetical protein
MGAVEMNMRGNELARTETKNQYLSLVSEESTNIAYSASNGHDVLSFHTTQ